jgi:hypothetical protein
MSQSNTSLPKEIVVSAYATSYTPDLADRYRLFPLELEGPLEVFRVERPES